MGGLYLGTRYLFRKKGQALLSAVMVSGMGVALLTALVSYIIKSNEEKLSMMNEADAKFLNEMTFARVGQAIASTAILCNELTKSCYWNNNPKQNFQTSKYGFSNWSVNGTHAEFKVENCLPTKQDVQDASTNLKKCEKYFSQVQLEILSIQDAIDKEVIKKDANNLNTTTDNDHYVLTMRVETKFISGANGNEQAFVSSALMRRPRSMVSILPGLVKCSPTCPVPSGQTRVEAVCYGPIGLPSGITNTAQVENMKIRNDGPGWLYRIGLKRGFVPNADMLNANASTGLTAAMTEVKEIPFKDPGDATYDMQIAPGDSVAFSDQVECAHQTLIHERTVNHVSYAATQTVTGAGFTGTGQSVSHPPSQLFTSSVYNPNSSRKTGDAHYTVDSPKLVPSNYLLLDSEGAAIPATETNITNTTHTFTVITPIVYIGQN